MCCIMLHHVSILQSSPKYFIGGVITNDISILGWGWISDTEMATTLQKLTVPVLPHKYCESINIPLIDESPRLVASMMCAGYIDGKRDSCKVNT